MMHWTFYNGARKNEPKTRRLKMEEKRFQFKRILCPVDLSPASLQAFDLAIRVAAFHRAHIHVLHVIPRIVASLLDIPTARSSWTAANEEKAKRELPKLKENARKQGIAATTEIRLGDIDVEILKVLKAIRADLVVMGTHGRRGFERWALGSVAERMLRYSPVPMLLTARTGRASQKSFRKILVTSDFAPESRDAVARAVSLASQTGASLTLLHVIQDQSATVDWKASPDQTAAIRDRLQDLVATRGKAAPVVKTKVESGEPYHVILNTIKDLKPSLVILNTHGHGFLHRLLIGSTADRVVRGGAGLCPILLIPPKRRMTSR
jgi:nucleotide-binding universal stress UspA family protein